MPALDAAAGQPGGEAPSGGARGPWRRAVVERRAAELGGPDDQRVVEHPARFRSREQAGDRPVDVPRQRPWSAMSPCESQLFDEPVSISSTNRTPRSASRRATRHCQAKPCVLAALQAVERERRVGLPATGRTPRAPRAACRRPSRTTGCRAARSASPAAPRQVRRG